MFGVNNINVSFSDIIMNTTVTEALSGISSKNFVQADPSQLNKDKVVEDISISNTVSDKVETDEEEEINVTKKEEVEDLQCLTNNTRDSRTRWCKSQSQNVSEREVNSCVLGFCSICCSTSKYIMKCNDNCNSKLVKIPLKSYDIINECYNKNNPSDNNQIKLEACKSCCDSKNDIYLHPNDYQFCQNLCMSK